MGSKLVGSGDLATVTGYYRPGRMELLGWVEFHSGEISPGQAVMSRISRRRLSESLDLLRTGGGNGVEMRNCVPSALSTPLPPSSSPYVNQIFEKGE